MRRRRKLWIALFAVPIVLLGGDALYWRIAEQNLADGLAAWMAGRQAAGWIAIGGEPVRSGWPLAATLTVPGVVLKGGEQDIPGGLAWSTDRIILRTALLHPRTLEIMSQGTQRLRLGDGPEIPYTVGRLRLALPLRPDAPPELAELAADNLRAALPTRIDPASALTIKSLRLHLEMRHAAASGEPALAFSLEAEAIGPPSGVARALGPRITSIALEGALDGPMPQAGALPRRAETWRDGGGTLEVRHLALAWGPLDLSASATLALDEQLQPMGTGNAHMVGYAETLDALAMHNVISHSAATAAKAVLSLLAQTPDDGGPPDVEVPLTLQYRTLSMRQVPLLRLPELDWP